MHLNTIDYLLYLVAALACAPIASRADTIPQIWFAPHDHFPRPPTGRTGSVDYMELFDVNASWTMGSARTQVFKVATQFVAWASDDQLKRVVDDLKKRNIALAIEGLMLTPGQQCGRGVEGYAGGGEEIARKIKRLGGDLRFIAMDEPLWFGHHYNGPNACRSSLTDVARNVVEAVRTYRKYFPNVQVGDIEPITNFRNDNWPEQIELWLDAYAAALGEPLSFFHIDVDWKSPWQEMLPQLQQILKRRMIPLGVIYIGDPSAPSDEEWIHSAERHAEEVEGALGGAPEHSIFQSWHSRPTRVLPESSPGAFTHLLVRYTRPVPSVRFTRTNGVVSGRVTLHRKPVPSADLTLGYVGPSRSRLPAVAEWVGSVPPHASMALFGVRINAECACHGMAELEVIDAEFEQMTSGSNPTASHRIDKVFPKTNVTQSSSRVTNSPAFRVSGGASFVARARYYLTASEAYFGYLAIIFLDDAGKEIERRPFNLAAGFSEVNRTTTNENGEFEIPHHLSEQSHAQVRIAETSLYRGAIINLP